MPRTIHLPAAASSRRIADVSDDAQELAEELERRIDAEVRFDAGSRALYATDHSIYRQVPIGVVIPRSADDVIVRKLSMARIGGRCISRRWSSWRWTRDNGQ